MKDQNGLTRLLPNDVPISGNIQIEVPNLSEVSQNCASLLPSQTSKMFEQGELTFLHINARSLHQSHNDIVTLVHKSKQNADFILISETWLNSNLVDNYGIADYEMIHSIPDKCITGKGCAIYIKKQFYPFCKTLDDVCTNQIEFQSKFVYVTLPNKPVFIVATT